MKCLSLNLLTVMAKFTSNRKFQKPGSAGCSGIILLLLVKFQFVGEFTQFCCLISHRTVLHSIGEYSFNQFFDSRNSYS